MILEAVRPLPGQVLGYYRASARFVITNSQAKDGRLFELRSTTSGIAVVPVSIKVGFQQTGAFSGGAEQGFDLVAASAFTVLDSGNTQSPVITPLRSTYPTPTAAVRALAAAGAAAGMTGGTVTAGGVLENLVAFAVAVMPTGAIAPPIVIEGGPRIADGEPPFSFLVNEGLLLNYRPTGAAAQAAIGFMDVTWAEVAITP